MKGEDTRGEGVRAMIGSPIQTAYERRRHPRRRCEGHNRSPSSDRPMTMGEDTLEKV